MGKQTKESISGQEILGSLRTHLTEQRPVVLHNTYQGVPVRTEAEVAMVHATYVGLIVHPYQAVCIKEARYTFIESKSLPQMIRAYPVSIDYTNHVVLLKQLKVPQTIAVDLDHSWVAPERAIQVEIHTKDSQVLSAEMLGIAMLDENRVRVVMAVPEDFSQIRKDKVELNFQLESKSEPVKVQGEVHSLVKIRNKDEKRLEVEGLAAMGDEISILAFIAKREDQIMNALDKAYKKLRKGKKTRKS
jgi:hypothetical protein